ncbi:MAG: glycosyltransferase, partial [Planctomycetota bacterium]
MTELNPLCKKMPDLSIVIPAFNERHKILKDMETADRFLNSAGISGEIIVIDDGSTDETAAAAEKAANN